MNFGRHIEIFERMMPLGRKEFSGRYGTRSGLSFRRYETAWHVYAALSRPSTSILAMIIALYNIQTILFCGQLKGAWLSAVCFDLTSCSVNHYLNLRFTLKQADFSACTTLGATVCYPPTLF